MHFSSFIVNNSPVHIIPKNNTFSKDAYIWPK